MQGNPRGDYFRFSFEIFTPINYWCVYFLDLTCAVVNKV